MHYLLGDSKNTGSTTFSFGGTSVFFVANLSIIYQKGGETYI